MEVRDWVEKMSGIWKRTGDGRRGQKCNTCLNKSIEKGVQLTPLVLYSTQQVEK